MEEKELFLYGRTIQEDDLTLIRQTINQHWKKGRTFISQELCRIWNWRQPNGYLRDIVCRSLLLQLNRSGLINLPPYLRANYHNRNKNRTPRIFIPKTSISTEPLSGKIKDYSSPSLKLVKRSPDESLWNYLIHKYHYQGYRFIIGSNLKYIAYLENRPIACLGWGSATWSIKSRDQFIGWSCQLKGKNLRFIVNNSRFLILPWVKIKHLASKLLAANARVLPSDWMNIHGHPIYLLETFVERDRFKGTCYKAANWIYVGQTKGTSKKGHKHFSHGIIKDIYLYPLRKDFRKFLLQDTSSKQ